MAEILENSAGSLHDDATRRRAVTEYAVLGNMAAVSRRIGVAETTLSVWKQTEWFQKLLQETYASIGDEILANNLEIARKSQQALLERVENGDSQWVKGDDGYVEVRIPVRARDLAIVGSIAQDKARVQMGQPTSISSASTDAIKNLAAQFEQLSRAHSERVIEGESRPVEGP